MIWRVRSCPSFFSYFVAAVEFGLCEAKSVSCASLLFLAGSRFSVAALTPLGDGCGGGCPSGGFGMHGDGELAEGFGADDLRGLLVAIIPAPIRRPVSWSA